jgi:hypothetical protein
MTQFNTDSYQGTVFSGCRKYQLTIAQHTPFQYLYSIRFKTNGRFSKVFSRRGGEIRYENGASIRSRARPKRLKVSFRSFAR